MGFSKNNLVPRFPLVLKEENPEPIIGYKNLPHLADDTRLCSFLWTQQLENLHKDITRQLIEGAHRRMNKYLRIREIHIRIPIFVEIRIGIRATGNGFPDLPQEIGHCL